MKYDTIGFDAVKSIQALEQRVQTLEVFISQMSIDLKEIKEAIADVQKT